MYMKVFLIVAVSAVLLEFKASAYTTKIICYYQSGAAYQKFVPEDFNANLCTHINYAFIDIGPDGNLKPYDENMDIKQNLFKRVTSMKDRNKNLKALLSVGGGKAGVPEKFSAMVADPAKRKNFINSANQFIKTYNFDGLDIDWEESEAKDKANYLVFLQELKDDFKSKDWLITAAVRTVPGPGYDVPKMIQIFDFVNIMTYDYYGYWKSKYTGQNSALFPSSVENTNEKDKLNLAAGIRYWIQAGAPAIKLASGIAFYGRSFELKDPNQQGLHAPIIEGKPGVNNGAPKYRDYCTLNWNRVWDDEQKVPYKYQGNQWIGYDDEQSVDEKVKYMKSKNIGGVMIWSLDNDDVHGTCGGEKQVLLKQVNTSLK